jgi:large subunit ribosomal protein L32
MNRFFTEFGVVLQRFESLLPSLFGRYPFPPGELEDSPNILAEFSISGSFGVLAVDSPIQPSPSPQPFSVKDLIGDGLLWAVPKSRRTIERRLKRKYGTPEYFMKTLKKKTHLRICDSCGNHCEVGIICAHCYAKVRTETESIKDKIMKKLHLQPVESEVVVLYDGEKVEKSEEFWKGKRIVEMEKPRPQFFSKNLLQKSTQANATTTEVDLKKDLS